MTESFFYSFVLTVIGVGLFSYIDKARRSITVVSCACGAVAFIVSEALLPVYGSGFIMYFLSAAVVCLCSECGARVLRTPVTVILLPAIIPLVPGSLLYTAMGALMKGEADWYSVYGREALYATAGIGLAIVSVSAMTRVVYGFGVKLIKGRQ